MNTNLISITEAGELLGISPKTLRLWEKEGKLCSMKTVGGHRRYNPRILLKLVSADKSEDSKTTICYARVSTQDQKKDLETQVDVLTKFCESNKWMLFDIISDLGSGLNYKKKGLSRLIKLICSEAIQRLVVMNKDRLLRFGSEIIFDLCEIFGVEVIIINSSQQTTFEEELANDVLEIITVFSSRLYGSRSHKNKKLIKELKEAAESL